MAQDYTIFKVGKEESFLSFSEFFCCLFLERERNGLNIYKAGLDGWTKIEQRGCVDVNQITEVFGIATVTMVWFNCGVWVSALWWENEIGRMAIGSEIEVCVTRWRFRLEESRRDWWRLEVGWEEKLNKLTWRNHRRWRVFDSNRGGERARDLVR